MLYDTVSAAGVATIRGEKNNKKASFCTQSPGRVKPTIHVKTEHCIKINYGFTSTDYKKKMIP